MGKNKRIKRVRTHIYKKMFAQTLVWAAETGNISLAWLGLVAAKLAGPGWLLGKLMGWLGSDGSRLTGLQLELAGSWMGGLGWNFSVGPMGEVKMPPSKELWIRRSSNTF